MVAGGANANAEVQGVTAIFVASQNGHLDALEALLKVSDKVNANVLDGDTALHAATYKGHLDVVRALLAAGAKVNARGCDGATALMIASQDGAAELASLLRGDHRRPLKHARAIVAESQSRAHAYGERFIAVCESAIKRQAASESHRSAGSVAPTNHGATASYLD